MLRYIRNSFAFLYFKVLRLFFIRKNSDGKSILLINTGNLGDIIVSSLILEYDEQIEGYENIYLLIKKEFSDLLKNYNGNVKIIKWNYRRYKWDLFYRIKFLKYLHSLNLKATLNLTTARGVTCDEIALLSGAHEIICLNSNWKYLRKLFGRKMDSLYDKILHKDVLNEYEKHKKVLEFLTDSNRFQVITNSSKVFNDNAVPAEINLQIQGQKFVTVSPFTSDPERSYGVNNFRIICNKLSERFYVILLGSQNEKKLANEIAEGNEKILNFAGQIPLSKIPGVISASQLYIGNDSGLTHIALKLNVPLIAVIGGGNYGKYFPYEESEKRKFIFNQMDCFGCEWDCIYPERFCITEVKVGTVLEQASEILHLLSS